jgi:polyisoprenoid-binding protein YceI
MKNLFLIAIVSIAFTAKAQLYKNQSINVVFFSETPIENIEAVAKKASSVINFESDSLVIKIPQTEFHFKKSLMEEHYNENYMESTKYPYAVFRGKFDQKIDPKTPGSYKVKVKGYLEIHGVRQNREIEGTIDVSDVIKIHSVFLVKTADHKIEIPKIVFSNIAESIKVTIDGQYVFLK